MCLLKCFFVFSFFPFCFKHTVFSFAFSLYCVPPDIRFFIVTCCEAKKKNNKQTKQHITTSSTVQGAILQEATTPPPPEDTVEDLEDRDKVEEVEEEASEKVVPDLRIYLY